MDKGQREEISDAATGVEDRFAVSWVDEAHDEIDDRQRGKELRGFVALEGVCKVVEDELVKVAFRREDERIVLKCLRNRDYRPHIIRIVPVDKICREDFLVFARSFIAKSVYSFDEAFDRCVRQRMGTCFGAGNVKIQKALRVLFVSLLVIDLQREGLKKDAVAALID